jgi:hypothetical protein
MQWIDPHTPVTPYWVFGQEYPWNAIQCRYTEGKTSAYKGKAPYEGKVPYKVPMTISTSMANNLYDGAFLYPPSELSLYSLNFVVKAAWRIYVDYENSTKITVANSIQYYSASHNLSPAKYNEKTTRTPNVYMDQFPADLLVKSGSKYVTPSTTLDLNLMALDPVGVNTDSAIVGFIPIDLFLSLYPRVRLRRTLKTIATTNDLLFEDTTDWRGGASGFTVSQTCLTATWKSNTHDPYEITLYFKVTDSVSNYSLHMKHWIIQQEKGKQTGVALTLEVNKGNPNPITISKYVNAPEAEGGENNILSIALRDLDFASVEYHDYLQLGLNSVTITMTPMTITMTPIDKDSTSCGYQIRAVSIVKG